MYVILGGCGIEEGCIIDFLKIQRKDGCYGDAGGCALYTYVHGLGNAIDWHQMLMMMLMMLLAGIGISTQARYFRRLLCFLCWYGGTWDRWGLTLGRFLLVISHAHDRIFWLRRTTTTPHHYHPPPKSVLSRVNGTYSTRASSSCLPRLAL